MDSTDCKIILNKPAEDWTESFLLGNGKIGAAVYGMLGSEKIDLSEITFFSGNASVTNNQKGADKAFYKMRKLVCEGKYKEAKDEAQNFIGRRENYGTNLPVGSLIIDILSDDESSSYERELDLTNGVASSSYKLGGNYIKSSTFVSCVKNLLTHRIDIDGSPANLCVRFESGLKEWSANAKGGNYVFDAKAREKMHSDGTTGVNLKGSACVTETDGTVIVSAEGIKIKGATFAVIAVRMMTDYSGIDEAELMRLIKEPYDKLLNEHKKCFSGMMNRVDFSLCGTDDKAEKMFQLGRYLLLSSSMADSKSPAHLQGVWNDNVACQIGWTCDMHLDINTQMNYWLALEGNLLECNEPLYDWIEDTLIPSGRITAKESYGISGWSADLVSNIWGYTAPYWSGNISPCPTSGIWLISQYWEHYLYTEDENFLKERAFPVIKEAAAFFIEYIFEAGEYISSGPSISPENSFVTDEGEHYFSNGTTYETLMIRELFSQYIKACEVLSENCELLERVKTAFKKLLPYRVLEDGTLAEWSNGYIAADKQHRHTSHLLGLYPYSQITPQNTPELAEAAGKSIDSKMTPYENWEDTGWARSLMVLYSARLNDNKRAYFHLNALKEDLAVSSMLVMHPPTRGAASFKEVYELDGNTGFSMGVIEMLVQSHNGMIKILPALPDEWKSGHINGVLLRGNIKADIEWKDLKLVKARFLSGKDKEICVLYKGIKMNIVLKSGVPYEFTAQS